MANFKEMGDEGEAYVNMLAFGTYLKYWCYPNPEDIAGDYKEFCDLLILFRDIAIIISVKNHHYDGDYEKYQKKVIDKSSRQLNGAYRKLFGTAKSIQIKHPDRQAEAFDPVLYKHIFRITINVGEQFENYGLSDEGNGKGFINILNKDTFEAMLEDLDTINDLKDYLIKREVLLRSGINLNGKCREKDLLAVFVQNNREFPVVLDEQGNASIHNSTDAWEVFRNSKAYEFRQKHDGVSYFIDNMVAKEVLLLPDGELLARELMNTTRFERRMLAKDLMSLVRENNGKRGALTRRYHVHNGIGYLLMYYSPDVPEKNVDEITKLAAEIYSYQKGEKDVVVIAATDNMKQYKFGLFKGFDNPSLEARERLDNIIMKLEWFKTERRREFRETEFPG